ncbi:MAG: peptidoglycan-binding protein [Candidatus Omnitrophica bacterium]|nr:peptidoglycan-binding protein [Candidatus Omnitrophota bacterium]
MLKLFLIFLLVLFFAGCATPRVQKESQQLQNRITLLEQELQQKDEQIQLLEEELGQKGSFAKEKKQILAATPKRIQRALKDAGFYKGSIDDNIGPQTKEAIKAFQKANDLKPDGIVGKRTWEKLSKYLAD